MPEEGFNPFAGTTGLKTDFVGEILDTSEFGTDVEYQHGEQLIAIFYVRDVADDSEIKRLCSIGNGWEDAENGARVIKEGGAEDGSDITGFNQNTNYQRWINAAFQGGGDEWMFSQVPKFGGPWDIRMWHGSTWRFGELKFKAMNDAKDEETGRLVAPVEFISGPSDKPAKATRVAKKATGAKTPTAAEKAAAAKAKAAAKKAEADDDDPQLTALIAIAVAADSHDEFMQAAYEELEDADAYESQIVDEAWYEENHG